MTPSGPRALVEVETKQDIGNGFPRESFERLPNLGTGTCFAKEVGDCVVGFYRWLRQKDG